MSDAEEARFESLLQFLQQQRGFDFTGYKRPSLMRRVGRRMQDVGIGDYEQYKDYLEVHPEEFALLFNTILINVTSFFRDQHPWNFLATKLLPRLLQAKGEHPVRVWSAGCASGQEVYSLAMLLAEAMGEAAFRERVKIYATDIDEDALNQARLASYGAKAMENVPQPLRERYFEAQASRLVFRNDLRRSVIFGRHDLVQDAPISRVDLLVCRNTLMYFNAETQSRVLQRFHFALDSEQAILFLGRAEMLLTYANLFTPLDMRSRVFVKVAQPEVRFRVAAPAAADNAHGAEMATHQRLRELAIEESPVARIVVDANGTLVIANQRARLLFSLNPRDIGRPLQDLEISYRPTELRSLIEQAYAERRVVTRTGVERRFADGETQYLDVVVQPLLDNGQSILGAGISFLDTSRYNRLQEELQRNREEVQTANEELQSSNEELETTNEELQSSNEELETTNEELQSTNEELETMNEELQSTNEELETVNEELRTRTEEVNHLNAFLQAVLGGLRAAAVVLDRNLNVVMWNPRAEDLWGLRTEEVQGKPLLTLDIGLPVGELLPMIRACLNDGAEDREATLDAVNRRGRKIRCRVACTPLMTTPDKKRDGVVLTMEEAA